MKEEGGRMKGPGGRQTRVVLPVPLLLILFLLAALPAWCGVVALDPGHGGLDQGAALASGAHEKDLALTLARKLGDLLSGRHQVVFSREGDFAPPLADRAGAANHARGGVFVSLHVAPRTTPGPARIVVWHWNQAGSSLPPGAGAGPRPAWSSLQAAHEAESLDLAREAARELSAALPSVPVASEGLPLAVLEGADMPAILVEIPDPGADKEFEKSVAQALARALEAFLAKPAAPTP